MWSEPGRGRTAPSRFSLAAALCAALVGPAATPSALGAQTLPVGDEREEYLRVLQSLGRAEAGSFTIRPIRLDPAEAALAAEGHPWAAMGEVEPDPSGPRFAPTVVRLRVYANTSFPVGQNDGAVWQGKGLTTALEAGARLLWRGLSVTVQPSLIHTQNRAFELAPVTVPNQSPYAYPWRLADLPQRFGPDPYWTVDPGQSEIRLRGYGAAIGVGTASLWWGPARHNAIVMSNNAGGFAHAFVGTDGPVDIGVGELEVQWIWGDLEHTEWFDASLAERDRFLTGIVLAYSPSFLPGLSLGATRVFYAWKPEGGVALSDYFMVLQGVRKEYFVTPSNPTGDDEHDQMLSLFGRWVIPQGGFEVYWEWARNDHSWNFRDLVLEPDHSQGYTLGLQKALEWSGHILALNAELTHLETSTTRELRATPTYYLHHVVRQGYTQDGQVIGAGVGPGGNAQHFGADLYARWGRAGLFVRRDVRDNDSFYRWAAANGGTRWEHDIWLHAGGSATRFVGDWEVGGGLMLTRELNRYFYWRDLWNLNLSLTARWRPS